jgi:murein hydrolase activator
MSENKKYVFYIFYLVLLVLANPAIAQKSKQQLEQEKKINLQKIKEAEKILKETATQKNSTLGQLSAINRQIEAREALIKSISNEIHLLEDEIGEISMIINAMEDDLSKLKKEYASMIYAANKAQKSHHKLTFLFASKTFHQLYMRLQYMQQYGAARKLQVEQIEKVKDALSKQKQSVEGKKIEKDKLLKDQINQSQDLIALKNKQSEIIQELSKREKEISGELAQRKDALNKLDQLITDLIKKEMELAASKSKTTGKPTPSYESTVSSATFEGLKKKMSWPVSSGFISGKFGVQPHPVLKGIYIENNGIVIQTNKHEEVKAVYDGVVTRVGTIPSLGMVVIIKHGEYLTVYANLSKANVKHGQEVKAKQGIGEVFTDKDGISELNFQIWKNLDKLDPQTWLGSK